MCQQVGVVGIVWYKEVCLFDKHSIVKAAFG